MEAKEEGSSELRSRLEDLRLIGAKMELPINVIVDAALYFREYCKH